VEKQKRTIDLTIAQLPRHLLLEAGLALDAQGVAWMLRRALEAAALA
jgi:hypothetical protein